MELIPFYCTVEVLRLILRFCPLVSHVLFPSARKVESVADEMAIIAELFSSRCLVINSIRDGPFARSPISKSRAAGAQRSFSLTDIMAHMGARRKAWSECMTDHHKCQPSLAGLWISQRNKANVESPVPLEEHESTSQKSKKRSRLNRQKAQLKILENRIRP